MTRIKTYWSYLLYFMRFLKIERVNIELTNICNYKCGMCLRKNMRRKQTVMSDRTFDATLEKCKDAGVKYLEFSAYGESTLDPNVYERVTKAVRMGFFCSMTTNGSKLDVESILETGVHQIIFSLHATDAKAYEKYTKADFSMDMLERKIIELKLHPRILSGEFNTQIFVNHYTERKVDLSKLPDSIFLADQLSVAPIAKFDKEVRSIVCDIIIKNLVIYVDGTIGLGCCWDVNIDLAIGHILNSDLRSVHFSKKATRLVRQSWRSDICKRCYDQIYLRKYRKAQVIPRSNHC